MFGINQRRPSIDAERPPCLDAAERNQLSMPWSSIFASVLHFSSFSPSFLSFLSVDPKSGSTILDVVDLLEVPVGQGRFRKK